MNTKNNSSIISVSIEDEMQKSYLDYAMSVIVSRALPDCRDGLKPVHRRILFAMYETGNLHSKPYRKSARVVGEVLGKYHPHGDNPVYSSLVRMAQDFSLRELLIDGQGNFGSIDGDSPAQMRYTEVRLARIAEYLISDIDQQTVDFQDNYDGSESEPIVLPARFPNLLVNGTSGIAVGMATNIPTHNLGEILSACIAYVQNPQISIEELLEQVPGPDFPTGGEIIGNSKVKQALTTGRGSITIRGTAEFEDAGNKKVIIINSIPYQVNKSELIKLIEELTKEKTIEGISEIRDETNKLGVRIAIELKKDAIPEIILNQLYKHTPLQTNFGVNMLALVHGRPIVMNLHSIISHFIQFREEVVTRRIAFLVNKARDRAHILIGLAIAVDNIDEVIALIKSSPDSATAQKLLMQKLWQAEFVIKLLELVDDRRNIIQDGNLCNLTEEQAKAILEMRLQRLTGLEKEKINKDLKELAIEIAEYLSILSSKEKLYNIVEQELVEIKEKFANPRRTSIIANFAEVEDEDLIQREDMVVTITRSGYIKRVPLASYKAQKRGGKGKSGVAISDDDITSDIIVTNTHSPLLFFSDTGKVYQLKVYKLPLSTPQSKGRALINILQFGSNEKITSIMTVPEDKSLWEHLYIIFATAKGKARRNSLSDFSHIQSNGKIAIKIEADDKLVGAVVCTDSDHILISTKQGKSIRFSVSAIRVFKSRTSDGVRSIKFAKSNDLVISLSVLKGIEIEQNKREEYLKIPTDIRVEIAESNSQMQIEHLIKNLNLEFLTPEELVMYATNEEFILSITEKGFGKRTSAYEYRVTHRGGHGIMNIDTKARNGMVVSTFPVSILDDVILITDSGTVIRTSVKSIRITSRNAMGVKIISIIKNEKVNSVTRITENNSDGDITDEQIPTQLEL